jgi:hypothetical protein
MWGPGPPGRVSDVSDVHCKVQTRPLVREGALHEEASTCVLKNMQNLVMGLKGRPDTKTYWPTDLRLQT